MIRAGRHVAAPLLLVAVLAAVTAAARVPRLRQWLEGAIGTAGALPVEHWPAFGVGQLLVAAFGVLPASLMAVAAGAAYGMAKGLALSAATTMLGGWLSFALSRSVLRPWIARMIGRRGAGVRLDDAVAAEGWRFVCLLRLSPVMPFAVTSYGLGLTRIGQRAYLLGTLASLPALTGYVAVGAFGREGLTLGLAGEGAWWLVPVAGAATVLVAVARVRRAISRAAGG